ncbi:MAG TPA: hypothetical protein VG898_06080 [Solirubrobacterales bacterium]|nr:hypothetical protein [Solirubrobacterales bacterium]
MRARTAIVLAVLACGLAACGPPDDSTPVACLEGSGSYLRALQRAPGEATLADGTPIGDCLVENQKGGELATVGTAMVAAATKLNAAARAEPGGQANLELGYLLGAAEQGAEDTEGIHAELLRRLAAAARYSPDNRPLPPTFLRTYRQGLDAAAGN